MPKKYICFGCVEPCVVEVGAWRPSARLVDCILTNAPPNPKESIWKELKDSKNEKGGINQPLFQQNSKK